MEHLVTCYITSAFRRALPTSSPALGAVKALGCPHRAVGEVGHPCDRLQEPEALDGPIFEDHVDKPRNVDERGLKAT